MKDLVPRIMLAIAIVGIAFAYGFASHRFEIFPYQLIRNGYLAYTALVELVHERPDLKNIDFWDDTGRTRPEYRTLSPDAGMERIFVLGNERAYTGRSGSASYLAWIADRDGNVIHAWRDPGEIWNPLEGRDAVGGKWRSYPVGAELLANGDILVSYHGVGVFPSPMGLARFDRDSKLLWKRNDYYHHWFSVGPNEEIYVPDLELADSPLQIGNHDKRIVCDKVRLPYDAIAVLDRDGNELREMDMLDALVDSDLAGLFSSNQEQPYVVDTCDPMHLNDVQILSESMAQQYHGFTAGDLLVSFRTLNTIGVLDTVTGRFKWQSGGASHHQHSPRFLGDNRLLFFDNLGGRMSRGTSRILAVDVGTHEYETIFPREGRELPEMPFMSDTAGHIDVSGAGDRI
ncbi:MAG: arylsulfotransferase family protein, partial [Woeseiaceae bacterium]